MLEQGEPGPAVHLSHDPFGSGVDARGAAVVVRAVRPASTAARSSVPLNRSDVGPSPCSNLEKNSRTDAKSP
jgi:hypothetical protein